MTLREVKVGQVWRSTDERERRWVGDVLRYRTFKIISIYPWASGEPECLVKNVVTGRYGTILIRRLRYCLGSRGYDLVNECGES